MKREMGSGGAGEMGSGGAGENLYYFWQITCDRSVIVRYAPQLQRFGIMDRT